MTHYDIDQKDTICALATPQGISAIAVIRLSGKKALAICEKVFRPSNKKNIISYFLEIQFLFFCINIGMPWITYVLESNLRDYGSIKFK